MKNISLFFPIAILFLFLTSFPVKAQIFITSDMFEATKLTIKADLVDEKTGEPIQYASAYLVPVKDSVIAFFSLSDSLGKVKIPEVTKGGYTFYAEYMGYKTFKKEYYFKNWEENLGTIKLEPDIEFLEAAKVTDVGNPIMVKQDTIEYNASSFKVSDNAMLGDLLKKMPGIEVSDKGDVKVNGKAVSKITVNGKTFFFDDKSAALNNLPAKVVDKVKVIDKDSESAQFSGIADAEKEKVMDIELKKEYEKGWFGNAKAEGGSTIVDKSKDPMKDGRGFLYRGNAMVAGYNKETQVTFLGNANNVQDPNGSIMVMWDDSGEMPDRDFSGLPSTYQGGVNVNTTAIKGLQTDVMANYLGNGKVNKSRSTRTTFVTDGTDLIKDSEKESSTFSNKVKGAFTLKNADRKKFLFDFTPDFAYTSSRGESHYQSSTSDGTSVLNTSKSENYNKSKDYLANARLSVGLKDMGKNSRALTLNANYSYDGTDEEKKEYSEVTGSNPEIRDLIYNTDRNYHNINGTLGYVEPLTDTWNLSLQIGGIYRRNKMEKLAYDRPSMDINDYYSAASDNKYINTSLRLLAQYKKEKTNIQFGAKGETTLNEIFSRAYGVSTTTGKNDWFWNWSPFIRGSYSAESATYRVNYSGSSSQPSRTKILPVLDISNPTAITAGNIYLTPTFNNNFSFSIDRNNPKTFSYISFFVYGYFNTRKVVNASWFDADGINYSIPVNSQKPAGSVQASFDYNQLIGKKKHFSFHIYFAPIYTRSVSYQSKGILEPIDTKNFDYTKFMAAFWGDENGSNFYSGKSGFEESNTNDITLYAGLDLEYRNDNISTGIGYWPNLGFSRYSLNPSANLNTRDHNFSANFEYSTQSKWEFKTDFRYSFHKGYAYGYDQPDYIWNLSINKDIKAVTISLSAYDILNSGKNLNHSVSENYVQDTYSLVMGRYVMLGVKVNFGKMNQANAGKAQNASWKMSY